MRLNEFDQEIGQAVDFTTAKLPDITVLEGEDCLVEPLKAERDFEDIEQFFKKENSYHWTYLPLEAGIVGADLLQLLKDWEDSSDPYYLVIRSKKTQKVVGIFSLMRINPQSGSIEMGWVIYSPELQRTKIATESQYLVMRYVFEDLGYRRYQWECDHLNQRSRQAALRLGFSFEGTFRQATVYKGRTRDTDWFSILDKEWPDNKEALEQWLSPSNFDQEGQQLRSLKDFRKN